jgi:hypothetical protein
MILMSIALYRMTLQLRMISEERRSRSAFGSRIPTIPMKALGDGISRNADIPERESQIVL